MRIQSVQVMNKKVATFMAKGIDASSAICTEKLAVQLLKIYGKR